jgi:hypothetical protein
MPDISFLDSGKVLVILGEPATTMNALSIANAIFAAMGGRVTYILITPTAVLAAISGEKAP